MGKETGFLEVDRHDRTYGDAKERLKHYKEFIIPFIVCYIVFTIYETYFMSVQARR